MPVGRLLARDSAVHLADACLEGVGVDERGSASDCGSRASRVRSWLGLTFMALIACGARSAPGTRARSARVRRRRPGWCESQQRLERRVELVGALGLAEQVAVGDDRRAVALLEVLTGSRPAVRRSPTGRRSRVVEDVGDRADPRRARATCASLPHSGGGGRPAAAPARTGPGPGQAWPITPSGVQLSIAIVPPGRQTRTSSPRGRLVVGREHGAMPRQARRRTRRRRTGGPRRRPAPIRARRRSRPRATPPLVEQLGVGRGRPRRGRPRRAAATAALPVPAPTSRTRSPAADAGGARRGARRAAGGSPAPWRGSRPGAHILRWRSLSSRSAVASGERVFGSCMAAKLRTRPPPHIGSTSLSWLAAGAVSGASRSRVAAAAAFAARCHAELGQDRGDVVVDGLGRDEPGGPPISAVGPRRRRRRSRTSTWRGDEARAGAVPGARAAARAGCAGRRRCAAGGRTAARGVGGSAPRSIEDRERLEAVRRRRRRSDASAASE